LSIAPAPDPVVTVVSVVVSVLVLWLLRFVVPLLVWAAESTVVKTASATVTDAKTLNFFITDVLRGK
jgi:hypothetical protein